MSEVILLGLALVALVVAGVLVTIASAWRWLRRRNEVSRTQRTRPPLRWLWSPASCARLHRRLRAAVGTMRAAVPRPRRRRAPTPVARLAGDIERQAVALDQELQAVRRQGRADRQVACRVAVQQVDELERSAGRLVAEQRVAGGAGRESIEEALARIREQLDTRESAWAELARLERDALGGAAYG